MQLPAALAAVAAVVRGNDSSGSDEDEKGAPIIGPPPAATAVDPLAALGPNAPPNPPPPLAVHQQPGGAALGGALEAPQQQQQPQQRLRRGARAGDYEREAEEPAPADGLAWAAAAHAPWAARPLTAEDPRAETPPGFRGELYAPQKTVLAAMLALERRPLLACAAGGGPPSVRGAAWAPGGPNAAPPGREASLQARTARLAERFSFGKTVVALALVCAAPAPAPLPGLAPLVVGRPVERQRPIERPAAGGAGAGAGRNLALGATSPLWGSGAPEATGAFVPEVAVRYARYLPLTVVAAAAAVISQWEDNARRFTALRWLTVDDVRSLRDFEGRFRRGETGALDLVFVKAGRVTANFGVRGEAAARARPTPRASSRSLFGALASVLEGVPVARLIVDDYDMLKLAPDDCFVPALFTWLISATRRRTAGRPAPLPAAPSLAAFFRRAALPEAYPVRAAALDGVLNSALRLSCAGGYVDAHLSCTRVAFRRVLVRGGGAARALRALGVPAEVVEMVGAGALRTAAGALGIDARSAGDVVRRVLGSHLGGLRLALRALARVAEAREALRGRAGAEGGGGGGGGRGAEDGDAEAAALLRAEAKDGTDAGFARALAAAAPGHRVAAALRSLEAWAEKARGEHGAALERMRANLREGRCQCCKLPHEAGAAAFILTDCCQLVVCETCVTAPGPGGRRAFVQRCPACARDVRPPAGLLRVGGELDLEAALDGGAAGVGDGASVGDGDGDGGGGDGGGARDEKGADDDGGAPAAAPGDGAKLRALLQYLRGEPIDCVRDEAPAPPFVEGLLDGRRDAPWPPLKPRRVLVFAVHAETTAQVAGALREAAIPFAVLRGARAEKDEAVRALREGNVGVLLVTAPKDCGGLDLPWLSSVVFYHPVLDRNVAAQVAARGQRLGREHNLEVVAFANEGEGQAPMATEA